MSVLAPTTKSATAQHMAGLIAERVTTLGLTQRQFATLVGASPKHICQVFNGWETAHQKTLDAWAEALGMRFIVALEAAA